MRLRLRLASAASARASAPVCTRLLSRVDPVCMPVCVCLCAPICCCFLSCRCCFVLFVLSASSPWPAHAHTINNNLRPFFECLWRARIPLPSLSLPFASPVFPCLHRPPEPCLPRHCSQSLRTSSHRERQTDTAPERVHQLTRTSDSDQPTFLISRRSTRGIPVQKVKSVQVKSVQVKSTPSPLDSAKFIQDPRNTHTLPSPFLFILVQSAVVANTFSLQQHSLVLACFQRRFQPLHNYIKVAVSFHPFRAAIPRNQA